MNAINTLPHLRERLESHFRFLYPDKNSNTLVQRVLDIFVDYSTDSVARETPLWDETDTLLITYGNSIRSTNDPPLVCLQRFLDEELQDSITNLHILPFCPYSSDDGFSVIDYMAVDSDLGNWSHLEQMASQRRLMADLVINHVSARSQWFLNYVNGEGEGHDFFIEADPDEDYSQVVRPRASSLLSPVKTSQGIKHVWCTFSHDQVDLNFSNPETLFKFLEIIRSYLEHGVKFFRLDAIGYLWKKSGTSCVHLPETHEVVRLIRSVIDHFAPDTALITETNVPNRENLTYFGNSNEAHLIYNFSLAPLLVHALLTGSAKYLMTWIMSMPPAPLGCTYLNFTASHDGIGMRPVEGLLSENDQQEMVDTIKSFGGLVSPRKMSDGTERIYELNVSLFDALKGTVAGPDDKQIDRFLCSQTIMMAVEGLPAFYIHSLLATPNDQIGVNKTGHNRSINRHQWDEHKLVTLLKDSTSSTSIVLTELRKRIRIRQKQPAFHPNATQFTLHLKPQFFAFWRQSMDRRQSIFCISNLSLQEQDLELSELNLICTDSWTDLLSGEQITDQYGSLTLKPYQTLWLTNHQ